IGEAVDASHQRGFGAHQLGDLGRRAGQAIRLQGDDDVILRSGFGGLVGGGKAHGYGLAFTFQGQALFADRGQMRPARDHRDLGAGLVQLDGEIAANGAGAENCNPHPASPSLSASFSCRPMRCSLPVAPLGISVRKTIRRGTLKSATRPLTKLRSSRSSQAAPSRSTTAAAMSSPSLSCGTAKVTTWATAGWSMMIVSTSSGLIFSP